MDGFNVTLKSTPVLYMPDASDSSLAVKSVSMQMRENAAFTLLVDLTLDEAMITGGLLSRDDLQVYIACSACTHHTWLADARFSCQLPSLLANATTTATMAPCEPKVYNSMLSQLNGGHLRLLRFFLGNRELADSTALDDNLKLYARTFLANNVDDVARTTAMLARATTNKDAALVTRLLALKANVYDDEATNSVDHHLSGLQGTTSANKMLLVGAAVAVILVVAMVSAVVFVSVALRVRTASQRKATESSTRLGSLLRAKTTATTTTTGNRVFGKLRGGGAKSEKQRRVEHASLLEEVAQLEMSVRGHSAQLFQQLHRDHLSAELTQLIYAPHASLPIWNYKTYLLGVLFPQSSCLRSLAVSRLTATCEGKQ